MAEIYIDNSNAIFNGTSGNDSILNNGYNYVTINGGKGNDTINNFRSENVIINGNDGNDTISTGSDYSRSDSKNVTIDGGIGDDSIWNATSNASINGSEGKDYILNTSFNVTINGGVGNDYIENTCGPYDQGDSVTIESGDGNDTIFNFAGENISINSGRGNDYIYNYESSAFYDYVTIECGEGNDTIFNYYSNDTTINGGLGNDSINVDKSYHVFIEYTDGDGNDTIYGVKSNTTVQIATNSGYSSQKSGNDLVIKVGNGSMNFKDCANTSFINIITETLQEEKKSSGANIFSNVNVADLGGESKENIRNKAISGLSSLLKTDMSDVVLKNVDGLKTLDDPTRKKLSSLASIFKLANEANSSFGVLGNLCASAETFLGLIQSKKRDANWGKQVSDCVKNLLKFGNAILKLSDKELAKSLGLGLGGSLFGLVGSIVATTDGITDTERDNIVKDVFSVSGEFAKLVVPATKALPMEINLVVATASALYMGSVQMQKSLEKYAADGSITLTDLRDAKIDSAMVGLDEFASKMTFGVSDIYFKWLDKKTGGNTYSNMTYIEKAAEGYKILFNYIGEQSVNLAKNIGSAIGNWWTKITSSLNQKGLNLKGDGKNNILLGSTKKDTLSGGAGNDKLYGQDGNDSLVGGDGADTLSGGKGTDTLTGGTGNDLFVYSAGKDVITDYAAGDKIKISSGKISKSTLSGSDVVFTVGTGSLTVKNAKGKSLAMIDSAGKTFSTILGGSTTSTLMTVTNSTKSPVTISSAIKTVNASSRTTAVNIKGNDLNNSIVGGKGNDKIWGEAGNDFLNGGAGNDSLAGGAGNDSYTGGAGNDYFFYTGGKDVITDYAAGDKIKISSGKISKSTLSGSDVVFTVGTGSLTVKNAKGKSLAMIDSAGKTFSTILGGATTSTLMTVTNSTKSPVTIGSAIKVVNATKRTTVVKITGNTLANTISGGTKNDSLYGGAGDDSILGNAGNDKLYGEAGNDKLYGGAGNDELTGGKGNDSLWGDAGRDTFFYSNGDGKDVILGFETGDLLQITGTFSGTYNSSKKEIYFKVGTTTNALTLKDFSATSFNINGTNYGISGTKIVKK